MEIIINDKRKEIPSCFEELKAKEYELLVPEWAKETRDPFKEFCIVSGTNFESFVATPENEVTIWNCVKWMYEPINLSTEIPKVLKVNEKALTIPKDVRKLSIGQNIHLKQVVQEAKYLDENISIACAIYLQPLYDESKFDYDKALELKKLIEEMPAYLIRPIGFFLLSHALPHGRKQMSSLRRMTNNLMQRCAEMLLPSQRLQGLSHSRT
jgi:hypothetical protein